MAAIACDPSAMLGGRRKSFEAEDRDLAVRMRRLNNPDLSRRSLLPTIPDSATCASSSSEGDHIFPSVSTVGSREERYSGRKNRSLPRANSDSAFSNPHKYPYADVKRNHSLKSFIQKRIPPSIRRNRNMKHNFLGKENRPYADSSTVSQSAAAGRPPESEIGTFFTPMTESPDMLDLSAEDEAIIRPLHQSILGKEHCFEVITVNGSRCFCCKSAGEREAWIEKLKRTLNPNLDNVTRMEHELNLWIQEAKGVPVRKKYFCEICLDRQLFARTTSKVKDDNTTFWGEHFEFTSIPDIENITIHLYKDSDKKKKKDKDYIGLVNISIKSLLYRQTLEKWYTLSTPSGKNKNNSGETMAIRIKARFQSVCVLPMDQYKELGEIISRDYMSLCKVLRSTLSVSKKDELARSFICTMQATGTVKEFLTEIVMNEIANVEEESLIFRENTIATKAVEHYLKLVGMGYLHEALGDFISTLYESDEDCEVDGNRLPVNAVLEHNQKNLKMCCEIAMCKIVNSIQIFPNELREVFSKWRERCEACNRPRIATRLITASLFLRLICPAILNPSLFGLANEIPRTNAARTLTLVAKVIQNLANRSRFGDKEEYMKFMNGFVREQWDQMGRFLNDVTDASKTSATNGFEGFIDLGRELAKLHAFLAENLQEVDQNMMTELAALPHVIANISICVDNSTSGLNVRKEVVGEQSLQTEVPELETMEKITGDVIISSANDSILVSAESSSILEKSNENNAKITENLTVRLPSLRETNHGSENSLSGSESFNNSNNSQKPLVPVENITKLDSSGSVSSHRHHGDTPISFSNPAYHQYGSLNLERGTITLGSLMPGESLVEKRPGKFPNFAKEQSHFQSHYKTRNEAPSPPTLLQGTKKSQGQAQPISFSNPLQALQLVPVTSSISKIISQSGKDSSQRHPASDSSIGNQKKEVIINSINVADMCSSETESTKCSYQSDDTLSSRPSSTSTGSTASGDKNRSVPSAREEKAESGIVNKSVSSRQTHSAKQTKGQQSKDLEGKVTAIATSSNIPVSSARHRTGLQKQQQHSFRSKTNSNNNRSSTVPESLRHTPHIAHSSATSVMKSGPSKSHRAKYFEAYSPYTKTEVKVASAPTREDDDHIRNVAVVAHNATRSRMTHRTRPGSASSNNSLQPKSRIPPERYANRRNDYSRVSGYSAHQTAESQALLPETQEGPLSPEERTAQWVLSSIAPVPKDLVPQPTTAPPSSSYSLLKSLKTSSKNYEDISRFKKDMGVLRTRLSEVEEPSHGLRGRKESLMEQLKEGDLREARLLERLKDMEDKLAHHVQEKEDEKAELLHRISKAEGDKRREREELQLVVDEKDAILSAQRKRIASLEKTNAQLARTIKNFGESIKHDAINERTTEIHDWDFGRHYHNPENCRNSLPPHASQRGPRDKANIDLGNSAPPKANISSGSRMGNSSSSTSSSSSM